MRMAHKGKYYPLHFRRDLSLNFSKTADAMPRSFRMVGNFETTEGGLTIYHISGQDLDAYPTDKDQPIVWRSQPYTEHGRTFTLEIRFDGYNPDYSHVWVTFAITSSGADVFRQGWANSGNATYYQMSIAFADTSNHWEDLAYWGGYGNINNAQTHFTPW